MSITVQYDDTDTDTLTLYAYDFGETLLYTTTPL